MVVAFDMQAINPITGQVAADICLCINVYNICMYVLLYAQGGPANAAR